MSGQENELPTGWSFAPLGQIGKARMGKTILARELSGSGLPVYSAGRENRPWGHVSSCEIHFGDTVTVLSARGSIGFPKLPREVPFVSTQTTIAVDFHDRTRAEFLTHWLATFDWAELTSGGSIPMLTVSLINEQLCPIPPLNEQKRIVTKVEALQARSDAAKEALDAIPPLLEKFRQSVLAAAFRGDLTKAWRQANPDVEPASELLARIRAERRRRWEEAKPGKKYLEPEPVDTEGLPELPEGWCWATLETICRFIDYRGRTPPKSTEGIPLITAKNVRPGYVDPEPREYVTPATYDEYMTRGFPRPGDVLFTTEAPMGYAALVEYEHPFALAQRVINLQPYDGVGGNFLVPYLLSPEFQTMLKEKATGTTVDGIKASRLKLLPVPVAPQAEQIALADATETAMSSVQGLVANMEQIRAANASLNQSILAKAFRGELVPQDPNDEPASVLLERIREERAAGEGGKRKGGGVRRGRKGKEVGE